MTNKELQNCIKKVWECRNICQKTLFDHCLEKGEKHVNIEHVKLMTDCIQICQIAADFMTRHSEMYDTICDACAEICDACAKSCAEIDTKEMDECAKACEICADSCREISAMI